MGAKSKLTVPQRRKVVLSLIRREEPAVVLACSYPVSYAYAPWFVTQTDRIWILF